MRYPHQVEMVRRGVDALSSGQSLLLVAATGSGKGYVIADCLTALPEAYVTVPSHEIAVSIWRKQGNVGEPSRETLEAAHIFTTKRLYNLLMTGSVALPKYLIADEAHHSSDNTNTVIYEACGQCPRLGLTATAYRGTPKETTKLRTLWPNVYRALTFKEAVQQKIIAQPKVEVWPLINDDEIGVINGEFIVSEGDRMIRDALPDLIDRSRRFYDGSSWVRPTVFCVSSVAAAEAVDAALTAAGMPSVKITGDTRDRFSLFDDVVACRKAMVQVKVVTEGVDLPLRIAVDLGPTMSPMFFMQRLGRFTRPTEEQPLYICTNHNISRHGYLLEGMLPVSEVSAAQKAWGPGYKPSRRSMARALNLEGFGRFTVTQIPLANGTFVSLYSLQSRDGLTQYGVVLHPSLAEPVYFTRQNVLTGETGVSREGWTYSKKRFGKWRRVDGIPDCEGYVSVKPDVITPAMLERWKKPHGGPYGGAASCGLAPDFIPDARQFTILPILCDTRLKFTGE